MRKIIQLDDTLGGESTVRPVLLWGANGRPLRELGNVKTASEASEYIKAVEPRPGMSIILVNALGSYEFYDLNRNGDGFNESPYRVGVKPTCGCCQAPDGWIAQEDVIQNHYKTFETIGKVFKHHQNKDPDKSIGDILKSFWNPTMHRVELLIGIRNSDDPELIQKLADGVYPAVSMGCRIKFDVCTECGHRAPTRAQYCDHLKFGMRQVGRKGLRHGALNPSPKWFDLSIVIKPADQTGFMMKKVAGEAAYEIRLSSDMGEYMDVVDEKRAAIQKVSDIDKIIRGIPVDYRTSPLSEAEGRNIERYHSAIRPAIRSLPSMDDGTLNSMSKHPIAEVLSTLSASGVILTTPEFVKLLMAKIAPGTHIDESALDAIVAMQGQVFDLFAKHPQMLDQLIDTHLFDINKSNVNPEIGSLAAKYIEKRSTFGEYINRALVPPMMRAEEAPYTDTLHVVDPSSGHRYQTTRGAAIAAHDEVHRRNMLKMLGGGALLAGGYKLLAAGLPPMLRPVAAGTAAYLGYKNLRPDAGPQYMTDEGISIPSTTELSQMRVGSDLSTALPVLGSAALIAGLGHDYDSRLERGDFVGNPNAPLHRQLLDKIEQASSDHPVLSTLGALSAYGLGANALKLSAALEAADDSVYLPDVDIDRTAEKLGHLFLAP